MADERKKFQVVTERLAEQQIEAEKNSLQMQDDWEGRIRELQKEKYSGSIRLQVCLYHLWYGISTSKRAVC